jgi:tetratricopeptide (TPR) repeat protein
MYLRANELGRDARQWRAALELYERCIAEDPHYAPAWAGAGRMHRMISKYVEEESHDRQHRAEAALKRALELNPDLSSAENVLAHLQVDLGQAEQSMVRLLRRAKDRPADPELYAGLTHACRYCGLMAASLAATEQARRLDPKIRTSVAQTHFMLGQYEKVLETPDPYMWNLALVALGRREEALTGLQQVDAGTAHMLRIFTEGLRYTVEGAGEQAMENLRRLVTLPDPEGRWYVARNMAHAGFPDEAMQLLEAIVDQGFFCPAAFTRDPWLDPLRGTSRFAEIVRRAEARHRQAMISFLNADGDRILGVTHPV